MFLYHKLWKCYIDKRPFEIAKSLITSFVKWFQYILYGWLSGILTGLSAGSAIQLNIINTNKAILSILKSLHLLKSCKIHFEKL